MNVMAYPWRGAVPLLLLVLSWSPAKASDIVARIGDTELTVKDYETRATELRRTGYKQFKTATHEAKLALLDGIIVRELLAMEGRRRGLNRDSTIVAQVRKTEETALVSTLYETAALGPEEKYSTCTEQELHDFFLEKGYDVEVLSRHIVARSSEQGLEALKALQSGTPFRDVVARYSIPSIQRRFGPEGWVGWFRLGEVFEELRPILATMPEGEIYPHPVKTAIGWHVFGLRQRRPVDFEASREFLRRQLRVQKRARDMAAYVVELRDRYRLEANAKGMATLRAVPVTDSTGTGVEGLEVFTWRARPRDVDPEAPVVRLTVGGYLREVRAYRAPHPAARDSAGLHRAADNVAGRRIMVAEARRLGLDQDRAVRQRVEDKERALMVERLYLTETKKARKDFSQEELRAFYEGHIATYTRRDSVVTPFDAVAGSIQTLLANQAKARVMDDFLARLRHDYADRIEIHTDVLDSLAFADGVLPVGTKTRVDGDEREQF